ncbi:Rossmann-like and DUF2520 domain-containing protein [Jhaorihella thermophila]|uniref:Predicted oxidoreductase, contains short-chain dehydrogenase (SDR) and DUF2520 domains n=1 Tax=Jhaorihella thermophila TaxID=488547 RepID=A0A1H5YRT2_9RHOB|nr:DUF2520 domain-containing protein [Jhaorihella thermophila]SEG26843.1 Predicted oxidoreductase, contains short-chain dehydrogenase (SDR) and DUF2520 domains [Jhaorihella thermophila]
MPVLTVNLIGAGRVGRTLLALLARAQGCRVQQVFSSRESAARAAVDFAGAGRVARSLAEMSPADLWLLTVPDTAIAGVAGDLAAINPRRGAALAAPVALHCSGFHPAEAMAPLRGLGWHLASAHPVLSFADPETALRQFPGTFCGLEGDAAALAVVEPLLRSIGARIFPIRSEAKSFYHAGAVISNNFTVVLQAIARGAWDRAGVPQDVARALNAHLLRATVETLSAQEPAAALTGPAARGDMEVVERQGRDVADWNALAGRVYRDLSRLAVRLKAEGRIAGDDDGAGA